MPSYDCANETTFFIGLLSRMWSLVTYVVSFHVHNHMDKYVFIETSYVFIETSYVFIGLLSHMWSLFMCSIIWTHMC